MKAFSQIAICLLLLSGSLAFGDLVIAQNSVAPCAAKEPSLEQIVGIGARISGQLLSFAPLIVLAGPGAATRGDLDVLSLLVNGGPSSAIEPVTKEVSGQFHWAWMAPLGAVRTLRLYYRGIRKRVRKRIANWTSGTRPCSWLESAMRFLLPAGVYRKHLWNVISDHQLEYEQAIKEHDYGHALWIAVRCYFLVTYILFIFILVLPPFLYSLIARLIRYLISN